MIRYRHTPKDMIEDRDGSWCLWKDVEDELACAVCGGIGIVEEWGDYGARLGSECCSACEAGRYLAEAEERADKAEAERDSAIAETHRWKEAERSADALAKRNEARMSQIWAVEAERDKAIEQTARERGEKERLRALLYEFAEFCRDSGWANVADEVERRTRGEKPWGENG